MNSLAVPLLLPVEYGVFVLGEHLLLCRHLGLPPLKRLESLSLLRQRRVQRGNNAIDGPQTSPLAGLLEFGEAPWDLPVQGEEEGSAAAALQ